MIKLKNILMENTTGITPSDIYNFYFLFTINSYQPELVKSNYGSFIQSEYLNSIKSKYITIFKKLIVSQLLKYHSRNRITPNFDINKVKESSPASDLLIQMQNTFRSDMVRKNDVWIQACEFLSNLENSNTTKNTYLWIDRLNTAIHNTSQLILGKVSYDLVHTLDKIHMAKSINDYKQYVSKDLRQLLSQEVDE